MIRSIGCVLSDLTGSCIVNGVVFCQLAWKLAVGIRTSFLSHSVSLWTYRLVLNVQINAATFFAVCCHCTFVIYDFEHKCFKRKRCTFSGVLPPNGILPGANFTLRPSLAFFYIGSVNARHSSSGRQRNLAAWYNEWNYGTFGSRSSRNCQVSYTSS